MELITQDNKNYVNTGSALIELGKDFVLTERVLKYPIGALFAPVSYNTGFTFTFDVLHTWDAEDSQNHMLIASYVGVAQKSFYLKKNANNNLIFIIYGQDVNDYLSVSYAVTESNFEMNVWHRISVVFDPVNELVSMFLNRNSVGTFSSSAWTSPDSLGATFYIGSNYTFDAEFAGCRICNLRFESQVVSAEQIRAYHELIEPFFDPDPRMIPAPVKSFSNRFNIYAVDTKRYLRPRGRINITNGIPTVTSDGVDNLSKIFNVGEEIEISGTSSGSVRYTVSNVSSSEIVLSSNILEESANGLEFWNYTFKDIVDLIEPLKDFKVIDEI
ncbi:MAG: LamG-like jellyroll fold domain-containing protein [Candidatus Neomarinimicrobiota bacterium]|jgi:hypothetical protein